MTTIVRQEDMQLLRRCAPRDDGSPRALTVRELMTSDMMTFSPQMSLRDAIEELVSKRVSGAPVVAGDHVVGTLSANDILMFVASTPGVPTERRQDDLYDDVSEYERDDGAPPGAYFTDFWDDAGAEVSERLDWVEGPEWDMLDEHVVAEAMSTAVVLLPPTASARDAATEMQRSGAHRVLVGNGGRLLGIVTTMDITRAVAQETLRDVSVEPSTYED